VHQDIGHYLGALGFACAAAGVQMTLLEHVTDDEIAGLVGLGTNSAADDEQPQALLALAPPGTSELDVCGFTAPRLLPVPFKNRAGRAARTGSQISSTNVQGHCACRKARLPPDDSRIWRRGPLLQPRMPFGTAEVLRRCIRVRRSAHDFDPGHRLPLARLFDVLHAVLPSAAPFHSLPFARPLAPLLLLFVHRVEGLSPGLYALCRDAQRLAWLRGCAPRYEWQHLAAAEAVGLPLFQLQSPEDVRDAAKALSCQQDWAGNSCVAFAIFAEYEPLLREYGAWMYRRAHWEAGMVGQALYLAAESVGCSGTAMGCFFGPWTHQMTGIDAQKLQDVEHFTLGYALEDRRMQTIPPYAHLGQPALDEGNSQSSLEGSTISCSGQLEQDIELGCEIDESIS